MSDFSDPQFSHPQQPPKPSGQSNALIGILIAIVSVTGIMGLACCGGCYYMSRRLEKFGRDMAGELGKAAAVAAIETSHLSDEDKEECLSQVDRVTEAFKAAKIDMGDATKILMDLSQSHVFTISTLRMIEEEYLQPSGLTSEEKESGAMTVDRISRGLLEKKIRSERVHSIVEQHLMIVEEIEVDDDFKDASDEVPTTKRFKDEITDEQLQNFFTELKSLADDKQIPEETFEADVGGEFKRIVDEALGE